MTRTRTALSAFAVLLVIVLTMGIATTAYAQDYEGQVNYALGAQVGEFLPEQYQSDTLAAVNDGLRYPERPHTSGGPNPYAWTNYNSVQAKFTPGGGFWLDLARPVQVDTIVIYQFVDSYSASLPESVAFYFEYDGQTSTPAFEVVSSEEVSSTCHKVTYRFVGDVYERLAKKVSLFEMEAQGKGDKVVDRCVGVYEIEVYGDGGTYIEDQVIEETKTITRTIVYTYVDWDGNVLETEEQSESCTFTRKGFAALDGTGLGPWEETYTFPAIEVPQIRNGFITAETTIPEETVTPMSNDIVREVVYNPSMLPAPIPELPCPPMPTPQPPTTWTRLEGSGPVATSVSIAQQLSYNHRPPTAILASSSDWHDAMAGVALAGYWDAPIIYTDSKTLSPEARSFIEGYGIGNIVIVGGPSSVSMAVEQELAQSRTVTRVWGQSAQDTATAVAETIRWNRGTIDTVVVTTPNYYGDGVSIAPWAYANAAPILYTEGNGTLSSSTLQTIKAVGAQNVLVLGGTGTIPASVDAQLSVAGLNVKRFGGGNSVDVSANVVAWELENGMTLENVGIAGRGGPHAAIAGAALMGQRGGVVFFVNQGNVASAQTVLPGRVAEIKNGYYLSNSSIVTEEAISKINAIG